MFSGCRIDVNGIFIKMRFASVVPSCVPLFYLVDVMRKAVAIVLSAAVSLVMSVPASGIVLRHDGSFTSYQRLANQPAFDTVGSVKSNGAEFGIASGSGVLVAPRWVAVSAHQLDDGVDGVSVDFGGRSYEAEGWVSHPFWTGDLDNGYDFGLVRLRDKVEGITPAARNYSFNEDGRPSITVGYGLTGLGTGGILFDSNLKKRAGTNIIDRVRGDENHILKTDFDDPRGFDGNGFQKGSEAATAMESSTAPGDSGGGMFIYDFKQKRYELAGITSFGTTLFGMGGTSEGAYGTVDGFTRIAMMNDWITYVFRSGLDLLDNRGLPVGRPGMDMMTTSTFTSSGTRRAHTLLVPEPALAGAVLLALIPLARRRRKG